MATVREALDQQLIESRAEAARLHRVDSMSSVGSHASPLPVGRERRLSVEADASAAVRNIEPDAEGELVSDEYAENLFTSIEAITAVAAARIPPAGAAAGAADGAAAGAGGEGQLAIQSGVPGAHVNQMTQQQTDELEQVKETLAITQAKLDMAVMRAEMATMRFCFTCCCLKYCLLLSSCSFTLLALGVIVF